MSAGAVLRAGLLATACAALAACGEDRAPPYRWREGAPASFEVTVREELLPLRVGREVRIALRGRVAGATEIAAEVSSVDHRSLRDGRVESVVATDDPAADPSRRSAEDAALARVAEGLVGREVRLSFDADDGLRAVHGLDDALAAAPGGDGAAAASRDGLLALVAEAALARSLRAAGLARPQRDFHDRTEPVRRDAEVLVPGRGVHDLRLVGTVGFEKDGSPVVRARGELARAAEPRGPAGDAPPPEVGDVVLRGVDADAETLHDRDRATPLRGRVTVRLPFAGGATVVTTTSFLLSVEP